MLLDDDLTDADLQAIKAIARNLIVAGMYFSAAWIFGVDLLKAATLGILVLMIVSVGLGKRSIERIGLAAFGLGLMVWLNIVPVQKYARLADAQIVNLLSLPITNLALKSE